MRATRRSSQSMGAFPSGIEPSTSHAWGSSPVRMYSSLRAGSDFEGRRSPSTQSASSAPEASSNTKRTDFASSPSGSSSRSFG